MSGATDDRQRIGQLEVRMDAVVDALQRISAVMDDATEHLEVEGLAPIPKEDMDALKGIVMDEARADIKEAAERGMGQGTNPLRGVHGLRYGRPSGPAHPEDTETAPATPKVRRLVCARCGFVDDGRGFHQSECLSHWIVKVEDAPATPEPRWERVGVVSGSGFVCGFHAERFPHESPHLPLVREADAEATVRELEAQLEAAEQHVLILREEVRRLQDEFERMGRFDGFTQTDQRVLDPRGEGLGGGTPTQHDLSERREP